MAIQKYLSLNGRLRGSYVTRSQKTWFLTDALGSVTATLNNSGSVVSTYRYKPYGATLATTGVGGALRFGWAGDTGSRFSARNYAEQYSWHRHYGHFQGQWTTRDILWPGEIALAYCEGNPITLSDPNGLIVVSPNCKNSQSKYQQMCKKLADCMNDKPTGCRKRLIDCVSGKKAPPEFVAWITKLLDEMARRCVDPNHKICVFCNNGELPDSCKKVCREKGTLAQTVAVEPYIDLSPFPIDPNVKPSECEIVQATFPAPVGECALWLKISLAETNQSKCNCLILDCKEKGGTLNTILHEMSHCLGITTTTHDKPNNDINYRIGNCAGKILK